MMPQSRHPKISLDARHRGRCGELSHIARERPRSHARGEPVEDSTLHDFKRQRPTRLTSIDAQDVEAEARPHELRVHARVAPVEQRLLEFRNRVAPAELPEAAAVATGGAIGEFPGKSREALRLARKL